MLVAPPPTPDPSPPRYAREEGNGETARVGQRGESVLGIFPLPPRSGGEGLGVGGGATSTSEMIGIRRREGDEERALASLLAGRRYARWRGTPIGDAHETPSALSRRRGWGVRERRHRRGAELSVAPVDHDRAVPRRRRHRHVGALPGGAHARFAGAAGGDRECRGCRGQPRRRACGALTRRRLHLEHRHLDHAYADGGPLYAAVRPHQRSRSDRTHRQRAAADRRPQEPAGAGPQGPDRLSEGQSRHCFGGGCGRRRHRPPHRHLVPEGDRHALSVRALSRQWARNAGSRGRADRLHDRAVLEFPGAGARRRHQALCDHGAAAARLGARRAHRRRGRPPRLLRVAMVRAVGAEGHAQGHRHEAQCRHGGGLGRPTGAQALLRPRHPDVASRATDPGGLARPPESGGRALVADHQGGQYQGGMSRCAILRHAAAHRDIWRRYLTCFSFSSNGLALPY